MKCKRRVNDTSCCSVTHLRKPVLGAGISLLSAAIGLLGAVRTLNGQAFTFTAGNVSYSENFDSLGSVAALPPGWTNTDTAVFVGDGTAEAAAVYNVGTVGSTDRALGLLSSSLGTPTLGASFVNGTGTTISSITFSAILEQWRSGSSSTASEKAPFAFSLNATGLNDSSATWTSLPSFDLAEIATTSSSSAAIDGNLSANRAPISAAALLSSAPWAPGASLWIRWSDKNDQGTDSLLAVDDFNLSVGIVKQLVWHPTTAAWDTASPNWTSGGTSTSFTPVDSVTFSDSGLTAGAGVVNVTPAGVISGSISVQNTSGTYTLAGGKIEGPDSIKKTGAGIFVLAAPTSKAIAVNGGTLVLSTPDTGGITVTAGNLRAGADLNLTSVALAEGATFEITDRNVAVAALSLTGATVNAGTGRLSVNKLVVNPSAISTLVQGRIAQSSGSVVDIAIADGPATQDLVMDVQIEGSSGYNFSGPGTISLNGDNSAATGPFQFTSTTVNLERARALGVGTKTFSGAVLRANEPLTGANRIASPVVFRGTVGLEGEDVDFTGDVTLGDFSNTSTTLQVANHTTIAPSANQLYRPNTYLRKTGPGLLTLSGKPIGTTRLTVSGGKVDIAYPGNVIFESLGLYPDPGASVTVDIKSGSFQTQLRSSGAPESTAVVLGDSINKTDTELVLIANPFESTPSFAGKITEASGVHGSVRIGSLNNATTMVLSGVSTYSGKTELTGSSTLVLTGQINGTSDFLVGASATLGGAGTIALGQNASMRVKGQISPSAGLSYHGALRITGDPLPDYTVKADGSRLQISIAPFFEGGTANPLNAGSVDQLSIEGNISLSNASLSLSVTPDLKAFIGDLFFILLNDGSEAVNGTFVNLPQGKGYGAGSYGFAISYTGDSATNSFTGGNDIVLKVILVPEPGSMWALAFGLGALGCLRLRGCRAD